MGLRDHVHCARLATTDHVPFGVMTGDQEAALKEALVSSMQERGITVLDATWPFRLKCNKCGREYGAREWNNGHVSFLCPHGCRVRHRTKTTKRLRRAKNI